MGVGGSLENNLTISSMAEYVKFHSPEEVYMCTRQLVYKCMSAKSLLTVKITNSLNVHQQNEQIMSVKLHSNISHDKTQ